MSYELRFMAAFYCVCLFFFFFHEDRTWRMIFFVFNVPDFVFFVCSFVFGGFFGHALWLAGS